MGPPSFPQLTRFLLARSCRQFEHASDGLLHRQVACRPDVLTPFCKQQIYLRRPAANALDPGEFGNGRFIVFGQVIEGQFSTRHQFAQAAGIALFLAGQSAGAQCIEVAGQQILWKHVLTKFRLQLVPDCCSGRDAHLLTYDRAQERAVTRGANALLGIAAPLDCGGDDGVICGYSVEMFAQLCVGQAHGECACLPFPD